MNAKCAVIWWKMKQELHRCRKCHNEQWAPTGSLVWCGCRPRAKMRNKLMEKVKLELQKIMRKERQLNLGYFKW